MDADLLGDHGEDDADAGNGERRGDAVAAEAGGKRRCHRRRQDRGGDAGDLRVEARLWFAEIVAAAVERAAERADRCGIGGAPGHVLGLERMLADRAGDGMLLRPALSGFAGKVEFAAGCPGDEWRGDEGDDGGDIGGKRGRDFAEGTEMGGKRDDGGERHCAEADRVDVVEMGALEFDAIRRKAERLVDEEVGGDSAEPGHGDDGEYAERFLQ